MAVDLTRKSETHYDHAPIVEAVIEIQLQLPRSIGVTDLLRFHSTVSSEYPDKQEQHAFEISMSGPQNPPSTSGRLAGYRFISSDQKQIIGVRTDSFSFSRTAPYDRWESMREEAHRLWSIFRSTLGPERLTRVGVRYINRIDVPARSEGVNLDDYFETAPRIASSLPQRLTNFFMRLQIPIDEGMLLITETSVAPPAQNLISTLLDIDVYAQQENLDETTAWQTLERLRHEKNRVFEACITDRVRDLIK